MARKRTQTRPPHRLPLTGARTRVRSRSHRQMRAWVRGQSRQSVCHDDARLALTLSLSLFRSGEVGHSTDAGHLCNGVLSSRSGQDLLSVLVLLLLSRSRRRPCRSTVARLSLDCRSTLARRREEAGKTEGAKVLRDSGRRFCYFFGACFPFDRFFVPVSPFALSCAPFFLVSFSPEIAFCANARDTFSQDDGRGTGITRWIKGSTALCLRPILPARRVL